MEDLKKQLENYKEYELFLYIERMGSLLYEFGYTYSNDKDVDMDIINKCREITKMLNLGILETRRFGVDDISPENIKSKEPSEKYLKWYNFWHNWFSDMPDEKWVSFKRLVEEANKDVSRFLPAEDSWNKE